MKKIWVIQWIVPVIISIIAVYFAWQSYKLQNENLELSKPYIIPIGLVAPSKVQNVGFQFYVRNPSDKEYSIDSVLSTCSFETNLVHKYAPQLQNAEQSNIKAPTPISSVIINPYLPPTIIILPPKNTTQLSCDGFSIDQNINDVNTFMNICLKIIGLDNKICDEIPLTIKKSMVVTINGTVN